MSDSARILTPEEVHEIIRTQRKKKACYPCHQRKVGCDGSRPCKRCIDRDHPTLCHYEPVEPATKKRKIVSSKSTNNDSSPRVSVAASTSGPLTPVSVPREENHGRDLSSTEQFVGDSSIPGFILDGVSSADAERIGTNHGELRRLILPALGLHRSACSSTSASTQQAPVVLRVMEILPRGSEVIRLFQQYKESMYPLSPHLINVSAFEIELIAFLRKTEQIKSKQVAGPSLHWLAMLFAILAAGLQFSNQSLDERTLESKQYVHEAFTCLHAETGYITASISTITTLLVLATVLQNDMAAEVAWAYLGLVSRLAQSLGLHAKPTSNDSSQHSRESCIWKAIVWQDCLLSLCFGRRPCTSLSRERSTEDSENRRTNLEYREAMYLLGKVTLDSVDYINTTPTQTASLARVLEQASRIRSLFDQVKPELRHRDDCLSIENHIEHLALRLNVSFALATLLRPALEERDNWQAYPDERMKARQMCIDACVTAVQSFVDLHQLSIVAERSWAILHNGLSCALILLLVDETTNNEGIRQLQQQLLSIVVKSSTGTNQASPLWGPHARILSVFKLLESARSMRPPPATFSAQGIFRADRQEPAPPPSSSLPANQDVSNNSFGGMANDGLGFSNDLSAADVLGDLPDISVDDASLARLYDSILWGGQYEPS